MNKFIAALIGILCVAWGFLPTPAVAYDGQHNVWHYAPDDGWDDPIIYNTGWANGGPSGRTYSLGEGQSTSGVAALYVPAGHDLRCSPDGTYWSVLYTATGWARITSSLTCVDQANNG